MLTKWRTHSPCMEKQSNIVYEIPCSCGKVYISETRQNLLGWKNIGCTMEGFHQQVSCHGVSLDPSGSPRQLEWGKIAGQCSQSYWTSSSLKVLCIWKTLEGNWFNKDDSYEIPCCLIPYHEETWGRSRQEPYPNLWSRVSLSVCMAIDKCMFWHLASLSIWRWWEHIAVETLASWILKLHIQKIFVSIHKHGSQFEAHSVCVDSTHSIWIKWQDAYVHSDLLSNSIDFHWHWKSCTCTVTHWLALYIFIITSIV